MPKEILIGTNNQNKLRQFRLIFEQLRLNIKARSLKDMGIDEEVEEDLESIMEIAKKKAKHYSEQSGMLTLSDDLGLFVDALGGEPGIHAKRWHSGTEHDRCLKLQERLRDIPEDQRTAKYTGVVAIYDPEKKEFWTYERSIEGVISDEFKGELGFGYDPIFKLHDGRHFSELNEEERNAMSHRGKAIRKYFNLKNI
jgi:XTP/dITP diphosphohydrolase